MNFMQATEMLELLRSIDNRVVAAGQHEKQRLYGVRPAFRMKPDAAGRMVPDQTQASPDFLPGEDVG